MNKNHSLNNESNNSSVLRFIKSNRYEKTVLRVRNTSLKIVNSTSRDIENQLKILQTPFFNLLNEKSLVNSFKCESDSTLAAGEYSFLIYSEQYLTLYNIDGPIQRVPWDTNLYDSIKEIRWSSYYRSYLIMTARYFALFNSFSYDLLQIRKSFKSNEHLQIFTCHQADLWIVALTDTRKQILSQYDLSEWEHNTSDRKTFSLDKLGLYRTDSICAIENDRNGEYLALLIAERNQNLTVGIQRRRRLILISIYNMSPNRVIYFSGADDLYWRVTSVRQTSKTSWLLSKWFDKELTFIANDCDNKLTCFEYKKELRNLAITIDGHYLILRTMNSLDIYQID